MDQPLCRGDQPLDLREEALRTYRGWQALTRPSLDLVREALALVRRLGTLPADQVDDAEAALGRIEATHLRLDRIALALAEREHHVLEAVAGDPPKLTLEWAPVALLKPQDEPTGPDARLVLLYGVQGHGVSSLRRIAEVFYAGDLLTRRRLRCPESWGFRTWWKDEVHEEAGHPTATLARQACEAWFEQRGVR